MYWFFLLRPPRKKLANINLSVFPPHSKDKNIALNIFLNSAYKQHIFDFLFDFPVEPSKEIFAVISFKLRYHCRLDEGRRKAGGRDCRQKKCHFFPEFLLGERRGGERRCAWLVCYNSRFPSRIFRLVGTVELRCSSLRQSNIFLVWSIYPPWTIFYLTEYEKL